MPGSKLQRHDMQNFSASSSSSLLSAADAAVCYERGERLANLGHHLEALNCFDRVVAVQPDHAQAWTFRGVVLIHLGREQEALASCDRALADNPHEQEAWTFRGVALHRLGRYRQAYASYNKALEAQRLSSARSELCWNGIASKPLAQARFRADRSWRNLWTGWNFRRLQS